MIHSVHGSIVGITPARGGSKGVPRKNIWPIAGKPLIAWTIEAALESRLLTRYVVSTEDPEITEVARRYGAEILHRPPELAGDEVVTLPVLQHALNHIPADTVVLLQATSPIRHVGLIDRCIERFFETGADSLATGFLCKEAEYGTNLRRRQEIPGFFADDGNIYVMRADLVRQGDRHGKQQEKFIISREENVQIDDPFDFWVAERLLEYVNKGCPITS